MALAQDDLNGANTAWILTSTALVLFMTLPGLRCSGGLVRTKNVLSVLMQCFSIAVVISILWLLVGYSIAFGPSESAYWGGLSRPVCRHRSEFNVRRHSGTVFAAFQMTFAIITPALIVGAWNASSFLPCCCSAHSDSGRLLPCGQLGLGGGWLGQMGLIDFAGGTVAM